LTLEAKTNRRV